MRLTIQHKTFLASFALATMLALLLLLVMRWNLEQGFARYTTAAEFSRLDWIVRNIEREYAAHGNWDFVRAAPGPVWRRLQHPTADAINPPPMIAGAPAHPPGWDGPDAPPPPGPPGPGRLPGRPSDALGIGPRLALVDAQGQHLAGNARATATAERPILHDGVVVGRLTLAASSASANQLDAAFIASQTHTMVLIALAALGLSLAAAWLLARHLLAPIRQLAAGARRIAEGWLDARIKVQREDELGELAADFNAMADRLARVEEARRAWIAEASHELRTPLAVLRAEIEAVQDGVRAPDAATLARLHKQVQQLARLVDDLRLTLDRAPGAADPEHTALAPLAVLDEVIDAFRDKYAAAGIALDTDDLRDAGWIVRGDLLRLNQVFANLLENSLRYTHAGGRLRIAAHADGRRLVLEFDDTAPAPPPEALPRLFERFFRAEPSRSREHGGSGLGLAICKSIVEAHGGCIAAALSELGGLAIRIDLPLEKST
ncbi:MAG: ATP-binding protein [Sulfuritalea sp.]|nr:ATP-binding protein [Sulfuritalea sp.]MDP1982640.1 ATP-binding protein [Sulfuritalea sp.]